MYAFTTQTSDVSVKSRASRIDGRATFTIVVSRTIISSPMQRRSEEHTSELQLTNLVCRLLLEKKKKLRIRQEIRRRQARQRRRGARARVGHGILASRRRRFRVDSVSAAASDH